jgi:hypothetical protein
VENQKNGVPQFQIWKVFQQGEMQGLQKNQSETQVFWPPFRLI